jgi:hypothetical protein
MQLMLNVRGEVCSLGYFIYQFLYSIVYKLHLKYSFLRSSLQLTLNVQVMRTCYILLLPSLEAAAHMQAYLCSIDAYIMQSCMRRAKSLEICKVVPIATRFNYCFSSGWSGRCR